MMRLTGVVAAVLAVALLVPLSRGLFVAPSADPEPPDPREIVAGAVGIDAGDVSIRSVRAVDRGRQQRVMARVGDGETEKVLVCVEYESDTGVLRVAQWLGAIVYEPVDQSIPIEEAQQQAEQLMSRLFPPVPVDMEVVTADRMSQISAYQFHWRARILDSVSTGDNVIVLISSITGKPILYSQVVAHMRPSLEDITVTREQAIAIAIESTERIWRETFGRRVTVEVTKATLILSSVISTDYGPVWLVKQEVKSADTGDRMELSTRAIDAMSGEMLQ